ncbi:MAG: hypothetical protein WC264_03515 [Candidatus Paceibacterota bacterium]|jgi:hypothetical protein
MKTIIFLLKFLWRIIKGIFTFFGNDEDGSDVAYTGSFVCGLMCSIILYFEQSLKINFFFFFILAFVGSFICAYIICLIVASRGDPEDVRGDDLNGF